ncbi:MAG: DUF924 family protein [Polyangiaceae bacterium]
MFRDTPEMFDSDPRALELAKDALGRGDERELALAERMFLYMPLMHSEKLADQEQCVKLFQSLCEQQTDPALREKMQGALSYAERHRDIVRRFGRFPHRNVVLERTSTEAEIDFLLEPNSSF